ncbi:hepatocyte growth factor activator [Pleurodeles waltl]
MGSRLILALAFASCCSYVCAQKNRMGFFGSRWTVMETREQRRPVLTEDGRECKFPFRHRGRIHYSCTSNSFSLKKWCATTHNHDRDGEWGLCEIVDEIVIQDHCARNPCKNGGLCFNAYDHRSYYCRCPEEFTGQDCETAKCFDFALYEYFDVGERWPRMHQREVEQCTCNNGQIECEKAQRYSDCSNNLCPPQTACKMLLTGETVCACKGNYVGRHCNIDPNKKCYYRNRADMYRGTERTTQSGSECIPWNSDLLFDEMRSDLVEDAIEKGLGSHPYCRSPDGDELPWCYTTKDQHISWEKCNVSRCRESAGRRVIIEEESLKPTCGLKHSKRVIARGRILGGTSAMPASHPWLAAIYIGENFCGGSLILPCWVVTAAHCFSNNPKKSTVRVVLGQHFFNKSTDVTQTFEIDRYVLYDHFSIFSQTENDIALIKLKKNNKGCAKKTQFVQTICLPEEGVHFPPGHSCEIAGWGHMDDKTQEYANHLQEAIVPILPDNKCSSPEVYGSEITDNMFCAGYTDCRIDACQGDSGGPLACQTGKVSYLYGIISWGDGCGLKPGVYTKVSNFVDWIHSKTNTKKPTHN